MNENDMYNGFALSVLNKLREKVSGKIIFGIYKDSDMIVFKVFFKDFQFKYAIKDVTQIILTGNIDKVVDELTAKYKNVVLKAFFKA